MRNLLQERIGESMTIDQFGDNALAGVLLNVQDDYATLYTAGKQLVHYPYAQIKSICTNIAEFGTYVPWMEHPFPPSFQEVLASLCKQLVKVENGEGTVTGLLISAQEGLIQLLKSDRQMIYYPVGQLKNISPVLLYPKTDSPSATTGEQPTETTDANLVAAASGTHEQTAKGSDPLVSSGEQTSETSLGQFPDSAAQEAVEFVPAHTVYALSDPLPLPSLDPAPRSQLESSPLSVRSQVAPFAEKLCEEHEDDGQEAALDINSLSSTWFATDRPRSQPLPNIYTVPSRRKSRRRKLVLTDN
jgi:hypothetical protein